MGVGAERHDLQSQETHAAKWLGFRQPVRRVAMERMGKKVEFTHQANPGEVWEEDEFWINLSWRIDPDGSLGVRQHYESPYRPGQRVTVEEVLPVAVRELGARPALGEPQARTDAAGLHAQVRRVPGAEGHVRSAPEEALAEGPGRQHHRGRGDPEERQDHRRRRRR